MSLLESVLALTLFSILSLSGLSVWRYSSNRSLRDAALAQLTLQSNQLLDLISADIRNAAFCEVRTVGGASVLLVALPELGVDTNSDAVTDYFTPSSATGEAQLRTRPGSFVWYGASNASWEFSSAATQFKRQVTSRDRLPVDPLASFDQEFNMEPLSASNSGLPRHRFVESMTFAIDPVTRQVTMTLVASTRYRNRAGGRDTVSSGADVARLNLTRTIAWENGF